MQVMPSTEQKYLTHEYVREANDAAWRRYWHRRADRAQTAGLIIGTIGGIVMTLWCVGLLR